MIYADLTGPILLAILTGTLYWMFGPKSKGNKNMSLKDIVDNDPVLKSIDKKIADMDKKATEDMIKKYPEMKKLFKEHGFDTETGKSIPIKNRAKKDDIEYFG